MSKQFLIGIGAGLVVIAVSIFLVFSTTKGAHLELKGKALKVRTGELDEKSCAALLDVRLENPSNILFVVREVTVKLDLKDGSTADGIMVPRMNVKQMLEYNKFLGAQYNDILTIQDKVPAHQTIDRMIAVTFAVPFHDLDSAKAIRLNIEDLDGAMFSLSQPVK
ncbi:MAG TPA: hypothetical protein VKG25_05885 [Bryobacteraceae bacterium]|nr:hypothetical protein [Bryobacteraceae bacterium]